MKKFEQKIEKGPEGPKEQKIKNLYQFLDFLEKEFGENVTQKLFRPLLEKRARANIVFGYRAAKERVRRLKNTEVSPITVARLNQIIDIRSKKLEVALRNPERLEKNIIKEKKEMFNAMKGKEVVTDGEGNIEVKTQNFEPEAGL